MHSCTLSPLARARQRVRSSGQHGIEPVKLRATGTLADGAFADIDLELGAVEKDKMREHLAHEAAFLAPAKLMRRLLLGSRPARESDLDVDMLDAAEFA